MSQEPAGPRTAEAPGSDGRTWPGDTVPRKRAVAGFRKRRLTDKTTLVACAVGLLLIAAPPVGLALFGSSSAPAGPPASGPSTSAKPGPPDGRPISHETGSPVGLDATGRLVVLARGLDNSVQRNYQATPAGHPKGWSGLGAQTAGRPVLIKNDQGGLTGFAIGPDGRLHRTSQAASNAPGTVAWQDMGGSRLVGTPAVAQDSSGKLLVAVRDSAGGLWRAYQGLGPGGAWTPLNLLPGAAVRDDPAVVLDANRRLRVFALGADGKVRSDTESQAGTDSWSSGEVPGGNGGTSPAVAVDAQKRLLIFVVGDDGSLQRNVESAPSSGTWEGWQSEGGSLGKARPVTALDGQGTVVVFGIGRSGALQHISQAASAGQPWSPWISLGGNLTELVGAAEDAKNRISVFAIGADGSMQHNLQSKRDSAAWHGWADTYGGTFPAQSDAH